MIKFEEAVEKIFSNTSILGETTCPIEKAVGQILYNDIISPINVVNFSNSAMDGFAVRAEWLKDCSDENRVTLTYNNTIYAGDIPQNVFIDRQPVKIMTGAPVPEGYDSVVKYEDTSYDDNTVTYHKPTDNGKNVRPPGEDIHKGQIVFRRNRKLQNLDIGILASMGFENISVYKKPKALILTTGNELVTPGDDLKPGQIYNSNYYTLSSILKPLVHSFDSILMVQDSIDTLKKALNSDHDIIITSGGVSAGDRDYVKRTAESEGWETVFHKAKIKPGKPFYFAKRGKQLMFGLPGNPLSATVTCSILVIPALKKMIGYEDYQLKTYPARLGCPPRKNRRYLIWPGIINQSDKIITCEFSQKTSSAALTALLESDGLIFQDADPEKPDTEISVKVAWWNDLLAGS